MKRAGRWEILQRRSRGKDGDADGETNTTTVPNDAVNDDEYDG
jgi:hypothetical protein